MMNKSATVALLLLLGWIATGCVAPSLPPAASFTPSQDSGPSPLLVTFDASESSSPNGVIVEYAWDFGDGTLGQGKIVSHSYQTAEARTFTVTLRIADHQGQTASSQAEVTVQSPIATHESSIAFVWPFHFDALGDDAVNLNDEYFTLQNTGTTTIDLSGWRVENERGAAFRFPGGVKLAPGAMITIHSGSGVNTVTHLFWNASEPMWSDDHDLAFLLNAAGEIVTHYVIVTC
ncbi:lamin tail domain-containing protein [Candidatus Bipolaricaulota bacterium]|nr:lamin tail domain-containing protein [Candidatus Bipolaricaulota bacterium]